jgi:hypothetical protein
MKIETFQCVTRAASQARQLAVTMARMLDLGKPCLESGLEHGSWVIGAQLEPGAQARLLIIGRVGELDAEMSPPGS